MLAGRSCLPAGWRWERCGSTQRQDRCLAVVDPSTHQLLKLEAGPRAGHAAGLATHVFGECDVVTVSPALHCNARWPVAGHIAAGRHGRHVHASGTTTCRLIAGADCTMPHLAAPYLPLPPPSTLPQVRSDLRLAHVYLCAPEVLVLLSDNFDYQSLAGDLVPGVLAEQELGSTMHIHELSRVSEGGCFSVLLD